MEVSKKKKVLILGITALIMPFLMHFIFFYIPGSYKLSAEINDTKYAHVFFIVLYAIFYIPSWILFSLMPFSRLNILLIITSYTVLSFYFLLAFGYAFATAKYL